jgi:hypothetical protein
MNIDPEAAGGMLSALTVRTPTERKAATEMARDFKRAADVRNATTDVLAAALGEAEATGDEYRVAQAALDYVQEVAHAETRYREAMQRAMLRLVEHMTGGAISVGGIEAMMAQTEAMPHHPAVKALRDEVLEAGHEEAIVQMAGRPDGITRVLVTDASESEVLAGPIYISIDGTVHEEEPEFDPDALRRFMGRAEDSVIDGIDLNAVFDPDANGRRLRDFDGGFGEDS